MLGVDLNNLGPAYPKVLRKRYAFLLCDDARKFGRMLARSGEASVRASANDIRSAPTSRRFQSRSRCLKRCRQYTSGYGDSGGRSPTIFNLSRETDIRYTNAALRCALGHPIASLPGRRAPKQ